MSKQSTTRKQNTGLMENIHFTTLQIKKTHFKAHFCWLLADAHETVYLYLNVHAFMWGVDMFELWHHEGKQVCGHLRRWMEMGQFPVFLNDVGNWGSERGQVVVFCWHQRPGESKQEPYFSFIVHLPLVRFQEPSAFSCERSSNQTPPSFPARRNRETLVWQKLAPDWWQQETCEHREEQSTAHHSSRLLPQSLLHRIFVTLNVLWFVFLFSFASSTLWLLIPPISLWQTFPLWHMTHLHDLCSLPPSWEPASVYFLWENFPPEQLRFVALRGIFWWFLLIKRDLQLAPCSPEFTDDRILHSWNVTNIQCNNHRLLHWMLHSVIVTLDICHSEYSMLYWMLHWIFVTDNICYIEYLLLHVCFSVTLSVSYVNVTQPSITHAHKLSTPEDRDHSSSSSSSPMHVYSECSTTYRTIEVVVPQLFRAQCHIHDPPASDQWIPLKPLTHSLWL